MLILALEQGTKDLLSTFTIAGGGVSMIFLLVSTMTRGRSGWLSSVAAPAILVGYSHHVASTQYAQMLPHDSKGWLAIGLAALAGMFFDRGSNLNPTSGMQGRRSPWPMLLWAAGAAGYSFAPYAAYLKSWQHQLTHASGALLVVSTGVLGGQALRWVARLLAAGVSKPAPATGTLKAPRLRRGFVSGSMTAIIALVLLLVRGAMPSVGGGAAAPSKSLLVSTAGSLGTGPFYIVDWNSGSAKKLDPQGTRARWSPDGTRMAYAHMDPVELWFAKSDGSDSQRLVSGIPGVIRDVTWSADGQRIYFSHSSGFIAEDLQAISISGGTSEQILPRSEGVEFPEVSPDGRSLAYFRGADSTSQIQPPLELKVLDLSSKQSRSLAKDPTGKWNVTGLAWTHDGAALIISSSDLNGKSFQLERVDLANPQRRPLGSPSDAYLCSFSTSPDGDGIILLAFPRINGNPDPKRPAEIWLVDPATGSHRTLRCDPSITPQSAVASPTR